MTSLVPNEFPNIILINIKPHVKIGNPVTSVLGVRQRTIFDPLKTNIRNTLEKETMKSKVINSYFLTFILEK